MARVQYIEVQCKSALNRVRGMPFKWSLNTYRGCAHACHYCYARASHTYYGLNAGEDFETKIYVKTMELSASPGSRAAPARARTP